MYSILYKSYLMIPQGGLRTAIAALRGAKHKASNWRTFYHGMPKKFLPEVQAKGLIPRPVFDPTQIKNPAVREAWEQRAQMLKASGIKGADVDYVPNIFVGPRATVAGHVVHRLGETLGQKQKIIAPREFAGFQAHQRAIAKEAGISNKIIPDVREWAFLKVRVPKQWAKRTFRQQTLGLESFNPLVGAYKGERVIGQPVPAGHLRVVSNERIYPSIARQVHAVKTSPAVLGSVTGELKIPARFMRYPYQEISRQIGGKWIPGRGFKPMKLHGITPGTWRMGNPFK